MEARGSSKSQTKPKKRQSKTPRKLRDSVLELKSPAEFFVENKNIAGFDNPLEDDVVLIVGHFRDSSKQRIWLPNPCCCCCIRILSSVVQA